MLVPVDPQPAVGINAARWGIIKVFARIRFGAVKRVTGRDVHFDGRDPAEMIRDDLVQCPTGRDAGPSGLGIDIFADDDPLRRR